MIRPARDDELAAVLRLWHAAGVTPPSISDSIEGLTRLIGEPAALLLVATIDNQIVGSVIGGWDGWRGNIYRLAVTPEFRRKGIARRLVAEYTERALRQGRHETLGPRRARTSMGDGFLGLCSDLGYERDPKFARCIVDRRND